MAIVVATALSLPSLAVAQPSCELPVSAYLTDAAGDPLAGAVDVELSFYLEDDPAEPPAECRNFTSVAVDAGWMRLTVDACAVPDGSGCGVGSLRALLSASRESGLWVGVRLGDSVDELEPRIPLGAVPFALNAENAARLGGLEVDEFERVGVAGDGLAVHAADPDAHHPANSSGIAIEPTSVTVGGARMTDGQVDLGPDLDDTLTAEIVRTLTGGGAADALHTHSGGSHDLGACYTVWGDVSCGDGFTSMYSGIAAESLRWDASAAGTSGGTLCIEGDSIATYDAGLSYVDATAIATVNSVSERITLESGRLACQICCR
jgi:hypothetical protein